MSQIGTTTSYAACDRCRLAVGTARVDRIWAPAQPHVVRRKARQLTLKRAVEAFHDRGVGVLEQVRPLSFA
jgi:hypothetical protein